jgi:hypothetical protein
MTPEQYAVVKADIVAQADMQNIPAGSDGSYAIAALYNAPASPEFKVWRTDVSVDEIMRNGIDWTRVDNLTVGKARIWDWMSKLGSFDASKTNIRAGIDATWVGTTADLAVRAAVYTHCTRPATRLEKLLITGTATSNSITAGLMGFEGAVSYTEIGAIRVS